MRSYINNGENRVKNNYRLNQKLIEYGTYGYNDYVINLITKPVAWGQEYTLVAAKEGQNIKESIFLIKRNSVKFVINDFLKMRKRHFASLMGKRRIYKG